MQEYNLELGRKGLQTTRLKEKKARKIAWSLKTQYTVRLLKDFNSIME